MSYLWKYMLVISALIVMVGCDVHQFPDELQEPEMEEIMLHLNFDYEMPPYKDIIYEYGMKRASAEEIDLRYVVNIYRSEDGSSFSRTPDSTLIITKAEFDDLNHDIPIKLTPGYYRFMVWSDYVLAGTTVDLHYTSNDFTSIAINHHEHHGNDDFRDAFRGKVTAMVSSISEHDIYMIMSRPMGKYKFVSTDFEKFMSRAEEEARGRLLASGKFDAANDKDRVEVNLDDYRIIMRYTGFMPHVYNMFTDRPCDAKTGVFYDGHIHAINNNEAELGFDYVFVNGQEGLVQVQCEVYNRDGKLLSRSGVINVELKRSHLTTVQGEFLTSSAGGGIGINTEFDGEYNIFIQ